MMEVANRFGLAVCIERYGVTIPLFKVDMHMNLGQQVGNKAAATTTTKNISKKNKLFNNNENKEKNNLFYAQN